MRKSVPVLSLLLAGMSFGVQAQAESNFKAGGQFRIRSERQQGTDLTANRNFTLMRIRPQFTYQPDSAVSVVFEPQLARTFGETPMMASTAAANTATESSGNFTDPTLSLHQAYADFDLGFAQARLGRQIMKFGDELVIGAVEWNNAGRSFDAGLFTKKSDFGTTSVLASKVRDSDYTGTPTVGDKDLYGIYHSFDFGESLKEFDLYGLNYRDQTAATHSFLWAAGLRAKSKLGSSFDYRAEGTRQWTYLKPGSGVSTHAYQGDAEVGYSFNAMVDQRVSLGGFYATREYNQLFPTAHKWLGFADVFGRRNIYGGVLRTSQSWSSSFSTTLDVHQFMRVDENAAAYKLNGSTAIGNGRNSNSKQLGTEVDLVGKYVANPSTTLSLGGSVLFSGNYLRAVGARKLINFIYADVAVKF